MMYDPEAGGALAAVLSVAGPDLSADERAFFREANPLGFILMGRNAETPEQLSALVHSLKDTLGRDCPVLIDQEGGRVQRLKPPIWKGYPSAQYFGVRYESDQDYAIDELDMTIRAMAEELRAAGINVDCAPVLDVLSGETHDVIGDRAYSDDPEVVARLGELVCKTLSETGITPVIKHLPGHGRAQADSHKDLPVVETSLEDLRSHDFKPFREVAQAVPQAWGMTAHVVYEALDADHPASVSKKVIQEVIRGEIGFDGFLLSDDLDMKALKGYGDPAARAGACLAAGCDAALYCGGVLKDMEKIAENAPKLRTESLQRLQTGRDSS